MRWLLPPLLGVLLLLSVGCSMFQRQEAQQTDAHRNETITKTTHEVGTRGGQPVDVTVTETTKKTRDDSSTSQTHSEVSSPALDRLVTILSNIYAPGSGGLIQSIIGKVGLNEDTAALLASLGAAGAGWHLHKSGKKKGHAEASRAKAALPQLP